MHEFESALHYSMLVRRRKRLVVLMMLDSLADLHVDEDLASNTAVLRRYLRQYTYIDYAAVDWLDRLIYALPLRGMNRQLQQPRAYPDDDDDDDEAMLLQ